jgi:hypothetical protein
LLALIGGGALVCTGCGGGGGGSAPVAPAPTAIPTGGTTAAATIRIVVPQATTGSARARRPAFVSPSAQSISLALYTVSPTGAIASSALQTTDVDLTATSPNCTTKNNVLTCAIPVAAPLGTITFGATLYAGTAETGAVLATFAPSPQHEFTIVQNTQNTIGISLSGVPASIALSTVPATVTAGTPATVVVSVLAKDAANNVIIGTAPYAQPIAVTNSDTSGTTSLSGTTITSPQTTLNLSYTGGALAGTSFNLVATYPVSPTPLSSTFGVGILSNGVVTVAPSTVAFLSLNDGPIDVSYGESNYAGTFSYAAPACSGVVTIASPPGTLHISPAGAGTCTITVSDSASHSASVSVTVNSTTFSAQ